MFGRDRSARHAPFSSRGLRLALWAATSLGIATLASLASPPAAHALECGQSIVVRGDRMARVRAVCGEPVSVAVRVETRVAPGVSPLPPGAVPPPGYVVPTITVQIEVWTYDFGPGRFVEELTFENGVLVSTRPIGPSARRR
ncbi:MAG: hypothetical protein OHK0013_48270 [Sandaracinaceae bacterium]